jgi:hypothetical protein
MGHRSDRVQKRSNLCLKKRLRPRLQLLAMTAPTHMPLLAYRSFSTGPTAGVCCFWRDTSILYC